MAASRRLSLCLLALTLAGCSYDDMLRRAMPDGRERAALADIVRACDDQARRETAAPPCPAPNAWRIVAYRFNVGPINGVERRDEVVSLIGQARGRDSFWEGSLLYRSEGGSPSRLAQAKLISDLPQPAAAVAAERWDASVRTAMFLGPIVLIGLLGALWWMIRDVRRRNQGEPR